MIMNIELWYEIGHLIRRNEIIRAINFLEEGLLKSDGQRFKSLIGQGFDNDPIEVARKIDRFIVQCNKEFEIKAVYLEMNGFDINPDRWFYDLAGYDTYEFDEKGPDWLANYVADTGSSETLTGLEAVQKDFEWFENISDEHRAESKSHELAILLVMCKFVHLIEEAVNTGIIQNSIPVFATAHDFDIVTKFVPPTKGHV